MWAAFVLLLGGVRIVLRVVSGRMHVCVSMYVMHEGIASWSVHLLVGRVDGQMRKLSVCLPRKRAGSRAAGPLAPRLGLVSPESQGQHGREGNPLGATALSRWQYHVVGRVFLGWRGIYNKPTSQPVYQPAVARVLPGELVRRDI